MKLFKFLLSIIIAFIAASFFFYKTILFKQIPFPGDLLVSEYKPWQSYSYLGYNPGSIPNKLQYFDTLRQLYPWKTVSIQEISKGLPPLWNPFNFSGTPLIANFQSAVFYPLNLIYLLFSQVNAWTVLVALQPFMASLFTYHYARTIGLGKAGSILASVAFGYSLYMTVYLEYNSLGHTIAWLPLILYAAEKIIKKNTIIIPSLLFMTSLIMAFLAGHLQLFFLITLFLVIYLFFRTKNPSTLEYFGFLIALSLGISAIQLIPTLELIHQSARANQPYDFLVSKLLVAPKQLLMLISPDAFGNPATRNYLLADSYPGKAMYIGLIPLLFALFSLNNYRKEKLIKFFSLSGGVILILLVRSPLTEIFYKLQLPLISTSSPTNGLFLLSFSLSILAGFGLDQFEKTLVNPSFPRKRESIFLILLIFGIVLLSAFTVGKIFPTTLISKNLIYSLGLLGLSTVVITVFTILKKSKELIIYCLIFLTIIDLFYFSQKYNPFVPAELVFPQTSIFSWLSQNAGINRFWGYGTAAIQANFASQYSLFSPDGYDPLYNKRYGEFIELSRSGEIPKYFNNRNRSDAIIASGFGELDLSNNKHRLKILNLLGVKYILDRPENASTEKTFPDNLFKPIAAIDDWKIYENKEVLPRFFLTNNYKVFKNSDEFTKILFDSNFNPQQTLLLEKNIDIDLNNEKPNGVAILLDYAATSIKIQTDTPSSQLLFISDAFYPGWKAYIDNQKTEIYRAHYVFRAVAVPAGKHIVNFRYEPQSFSLGIIISMMSLVLTVAILLFLKFKHEK